MPNAPYPSPRNHSEDFLVCGLGRLGQECVAVLKAFGVRVIGVDLAAETGLDPALSGLIDAFYAGDCGHAEVLKKAGVRNCRAVLLVTGDERNNIAAAFIARSLNPRVRLIIRSAQENLNALLRQQLGNLVAFEPSQFSAGAFALVSLGDRTQAFFEVEGIKVRVGRVVVEAGNLRMLGRRVFELAHAERRIFSVTAADHPVGDFFFAVNPDKEIVEGDVLTFFESGELLPGEGALSPHRGKHEPGPTLSARFSTSLLEARRLLGAIEIPRVASISFVIMLALSLTTFLYYRAENPDISTLDAINIAIVLSIGGFDNVFGAIKVPFPISDRLYAFSVLIHVCSTVFLGVVFATLTERLLSSRLQIARRRPAAPSGGHTIVIGMGDIGQRIADILRQWRRPTVGVSQEPLPEDVLSDMPIFFGPLREALARANVETAKSVVAVMDDQVANLEVSLLARSLNPECTIVFRTADQELARNVASLLSSSTGLSDYAIAAEAIAGAAFGENILSAFHLDDRSTLVTEYIVRAGDTLIGRNLSEIAFGYGVAPMIHQRGDLKRFIPSDDIVLEEGDIVVVLATVDGLRRVEGGLRAAPEWRLAIDSAPSEATKFEAANMISRISGCDLTKARAAMQRLPSLLEKPLYQPQGSRLVRDLRKLLVMAHLERDGPDLF
ncbi:NAD-binding protein [uncultured Rhodoblastus sp.]|uniref:potassium channel family protein n=1 Tax=uncultured Rhodoblastus sp. TaxID=543037 RepID=UPI0025D60475|nr:NAD-binding protein [uncultured Rhodoblastus sp.]